MSKYYFEIAWEVVNKVGGIYTVISSKAPVTVKELGSHYFMLGSYDPKFAATDVEIINPENHLIREAMNAMTRNGVKVYYGKWLIDGYPNVVLFDILSGYCNINQWRHELFENTGIGVPDGDKEGLDVVVFGAMCAWFLGEFRQRLPSSHLMVAHFHEWLSGTGLIFCNKRNLNIALIFTTHATLLGRHLAAANANLYDHLHDFNVDKEAGDRQIYHKYCMERAAANLAHVFTTVSKITGDEAEVFLGRKPDMITPNGLNVKRYTALHEFQNLHARAKEKINNFVLGHFSGNYNFDVNKTVYFFSAGRYEYSNKGVDIFLESLARLNGFLKWYDIDINVVAFLIFPAKSHTFNVETLKGQALLKKLKDTISEIQTSIGEKICDSVAKGSLPDVKSLIGENEMIRLKKYLISSKRSTWPPICTHNVVDDAEDKILSNLRRLQLINAPEDKVKVIFHPEFLNAMSPLFPIDYEEFVRGSHLGVFCSYYEPWGYTPAECTVMGIPSVTSDLAGFGQYIQQAIEEPSKFGIYIVERRHCSFEESCDQLSEYMLNFCKQSRRQRIIQRNRTERLSELLDWKILGNYYKRARKLALNRKHPERKDLESIDVSEDLDLETYLSSEMKRCLSFQQVSSATSVMDGDYAFNDRSDDSQE